MFFAFKNKRTVKSYAKISTTGIMCALILAIISFIISMISVIKYDIANIITWPNLSSSDLFSSILYNITVLGTFLTAYSAIAGVPVIVFLSL